jgi:hypothetical protein
LSPRLFGIFINDIVEFLAKKWAPIVRLGNKNFSVLLFADDTALVVNSAHDLQKLLDLTDDYLKMKCLQVNVQKSKVVIFNKRNDKCESKFWFEGEEIQVVDKINYLGYIFQSNGRWNSHIKETLNRGRAAMCKKR